MIDTSVTDTSPIELAPPSLRVTVSIEMVAYIGLILLAVTLRIANLDSVPMSAREAQPALAAWYAIRPDLGGPLTATSPLVFTTQVASMSVLGGTELGARIATALAGLALVLSPLLFRWLFGRSRTLFACILLASSPVLLLSSRYSDPSLWTMLLAVLTLWALWRYRVTTQAAYASGAIVAFGSMIFLSGPGAPLVALALALAGVISLALTRSANRDSDDADTVIPLFRSLPWGQGAAIAALVIFLVSTGFLLVQSGLGNVGALLGATVQGLTMTQPDSPSMLALLNSLFYEPFLWLFALIGILVAIRRGLTAFDRFFILWLVLDLAAVLFFVGGTPGDALWLTVPLTALALRTVQSALSDDRRVLFDVPGRARWLVAVATFALIGIFTLSFQTLSRSLSSKNLADGIALVSQLDPVSLILMLMVVMFCIVGFFLASSVWNSSTTLRGAALGLLVFALFTSMGAGWRASSPDSDNPLQPFHLTASTLDAPMLRESLLDVAKRQSRGFPEMDVSVVAPHDGLVAWLLRDFDHLTFYDDVSMAKGDGIIVSTLNNALPFSADPNGTNSTPDLGGSYVGQRVRLTRSWSPSTLGPLSLLEWWSQYNINAKIFAPQDVVIWLRQDIYSGAPATN